MRAPILFARLFLLGTAVTIGMAGCSNNSTAGAPESPSAAEPSTPSRSHSEPSAAASGGAMDITLEIDGQQFQGTLDGSAASASLLSQLPLTLHFTDYSGQEKIAPLPEPLDLTEAPDGSAAPAWTIGYYNQSLVLYYDDVSYFSGIVPLGTWTATTDQLAAFDDADITVTQAAN